MRVLHVTEAMGGGIVTLIDSISRGQIDAGANVTVWYIERSDSPPFDDLVARFHPAVTVQRISARSPLSVLARRVRHSLKAVEFDAVHLHSSIAGAVGRLALVGLRTPTFVAYSPHGFAFLRLDKSSIARRAYLLIERALAKTKSSLVLTAASEREIAARVLKSDGYVLQTGISKVDASAARVLSLGSRDRPRVGMVGRIAFQKAPWRFAKIAHELSDRADFIWVGDGSADDRAKWIGSAPVEVTGWVTPESLSEMISSFDVFLFPTLWEGMALSLVQAQAQGVPAVTSDAVGNVDTVKNEFSGYVCSSDEELLEKTARLVDDPVLRARMSTNARTWAASALTDENIGRDSLAIYSGVHVSSSPAEPKVD